MKSKLVPQRAQPTRPRVDYADPEVEGLLKQMLRTQLASLTKTTVTTTERQLTLQKTLVEAISLVLRDTKVEHSVLVKHFEAMYDHAMASMAEAKLDQDILTRQYIGNHGLIMSPLQCTTTIKDVYRIRGFARGLNQAIKDLFQQQLQIHILYPACGPFAPLLLPLMTYYKNNRLYTPEQIQITLVDIQPGAIASLNQLITDLGLSDYIADCIEADAVQYRPSSGIDILMLEAMQHGFTREAHLSIARHFVQFMNPNGVLLPKKVSVKAMLVEGQEEFVEQWKGREYCHSSNLEADIVNRRIDLGAICEIDLVWLSSLEVMTLPDGTEVVPCNRISLPEQVPDSRKKILVICAQLHTYGDDGVLEYDSGITHPLPDMSVCIDFKPAVPEPGDLLVNSGDKLDFYYHLTGLPGFVPVRGDSL